MSTSTSATTSPSASASAFISPPSRNTRSKRKSLDKENQDPNIDATAAVTEKKTQSNKKNTKNNKKQKTSARTSASASASAAPSSSVSDAAEDVKQEDTPRVRFEKYLNDLGEKYSNHTVMLLESLPQNDDDDDDEEDVDEQSDKEPNASYEDYDKLARIIIPTSAATAYEEFHQQLLDAIDCSDGFVMTWTKHSDIVMDLLQHQLTAFNNLSRQIHRSPTTIIPQAFNILFATTMVMTEFQFWYCDTEEPEACDEMAKNIIKGAWNRLLKRSDRELGFVEPRTRTDLKRWLNKSYKEIHQTIVNISGI